MKKCFLVFTLLFALLLSSCTEGDIPMGMQVAADGSNGYRVYVPQSWVFHDSGRRLTAYISAVDTTGIVLSYTDIEEGDTRGVRDFYDAGVLELQLLAEFTKEQEGTLPVDGVDAPFLIYTFKSGDYEYRSEALYILKAGRCYVVSFTSRKDQFESYAAQLEDIIQYLAFTGDRKTDAPPVFDDGKAPSGMKLASHPEIADYRLYVPESFVIERATNDTLVSVSDLDKSSLSVFPTVPRAETFEEYLTKYKSELALLYTDIEYVTENQSTDFGDKHGAFMMEFTGKHAGEAYRVRQYMMSRGYYLYIVTYTARDSDAGDGVTYFEKNLPAMEEIFRAFRFEGEE